MMEDERKAWRSVRAAMKYLLGARLELNEAETPVSDATPAAPEVAAGKVKAEEQKEARASGA